MTDTITRLLAAQESLLATNKRMAAELSAIRTATRAYHDSDLASLVKTLAARAAVADRYDERLDDLVRVCLHLGRWHLQVGGVFVASEGDTCHDPEIAAMFWDKSTLDAAARRIERHMRRR